MCAWITRGLVKNPSSARVRARTECTSPSMHSPGSTIAVVSDFCVIKYNVADATGAQPLRERPSGLSKKLPTNARAYVRAAPKSAVRPMYLLYYWRTENSKDTWKYTPKSAPTCTADSRHCCRRRCCSDDQPVERAKGKRKRNEMKEK